MQGVSFYKITADVPGGKIYFSDRRFDAFKSEIIRLFEVLDAAHNSNSIDSETINNIIKKRDDCMHKVVAVRYSLALIEAELSNKPTGDEARSYSEMVSNNMCAEAELKNEVLIYETENFLFHVKSSLDVLIQLLKYIPEFSYLKKPGQRNNKDRESFDFDCNMPSKNTPQQMRNHQHIKLANLLEIEIAQWIRTLRSMRNDIAHRSGLHGFSSYTYNSNLGKVINPRMPIGEEVGKYCNDIYQKLISLYKKIINEHILPKL